jgi:DUF1707 SHOCT-like domain
MTSSTGRCIRASDRDRENVAEFLMEAYAVGRLSREEFDERATAAYSARTLGELLDLTDDLPLPPARTGFPSDIVAQRRVSRNAGQRLIAQLMWVYMLVLADGVARLVSPAAVGVATVLILIALLASAALGISRQCTRTELLPGRRGARRD